MRQEFAERRLIGAQVDAQWRRRPYGCRRGQNANETKEPETENARRDDAVHRWGQRCRLNGHFKRSGFSRHFQMDSDSTLANRCGDYPADGMQRRHDAREDSLRNSHAVASFEGDCLTQSAVFASFCQNLSRIGPIGAGRSMGSL